MHFFLSFLAGIVLFHVFPYFPCSSIFISVLFLLFFLFKRQFLLTFILLTGLLSGISYSYIRYEPANTLHYIGEKVAVRGIFESYPTKTRSGMYSQSFKITSAFYIDTDEYLHDLEGLEIMLFSEKEFGPGSECELDIQFLKNRARLNPGQQLKGDLYARVLKIYNSENRSISLNSKIQDYRYRINTYIEQNFSTDSASLISSITTGHRADISEEMRDSFNTTGLAHILSISGTHFGLFSVFLFGIFRFIIKFLPYKILQRITIFLTPSQVAAILCLPFMLAYLALSGASIPAVRSFIMISLFLAGLIIGRKGFWLNSLVFAAFIIVIWEPEFIFSLSFQLSFIAVLFIGFSIRYRENEDKKEKKVFKYLKNILLITLAASIGTAPLVAYYFHYLSLISPLSNLIISPFIGFVLIPLSVVSSFLFLITGHFTFTPIVLIISDLSIFLVKLFSTLPFAEIKIPAFPPMIVILFYTGFIFYFLSSRTVRDLRLTNGHKDTSCHSRESGNPEIKDSYIKSWFPAFAGMALEKIFPNKKRCTLLIPFISIIIYFSLSVFNNNELAVTFLDVGQGDSSVIELPDGKTVVIDTGRTGRETASFLKYRGKKTIDALILSHLHPDHTGGLEYLLKKFEVKEIWDNGQIILPEISKTITHRSLRRGDMTEGEGYTFRIFHPYPEFYTMYGDEYDAENNDSLVLKVEGRHKSFIFTGDVEEEAEENILHLGEWLRSDVIKVPHHGARSSSFESFIKTISPDVAVISVGRENPFNHPHEETLDALYGVEIFRTDIDGAVKISETDSLLKIKTYRDFQLEKIKSIQDEIKNIKRIFSTW
jgi:competence protein ComEC